MLRNNLVVENQLVLERKHWQRQITRSDSAPFEWSCVEPDDLDRARDLTERYRLMAIQHVALRGMAQVQRALYRHNNGHKGLCEDCNGPIESERLEVLPEATRCIGCQVAWERTSSLWHRC